MKTVQQIKNELDAWDSYEAWHDYELGEMLEIVIEAYDKLLKEKLKLELKCGL